MDCLNKQKWEDLDLTKDEIKSIGEALKKEEFRNLLVEYVKEINDPDNRKQYEEEITQLEKERGVEVKFIHPVSGYVMKTSINGKCKAFINVCSNSNVGAPYSNPEVDDGRQGEKWSIPYSLAPPREDLDKKKNVCIVYDVVFHPKALELSKNNINLKKLVNDTALGAVEGNFNVTLDKVNLKFPKMEFKGLKHATVIRKKIENYQVQDIIDIPNYPYPPVKEGIPGPTYLHGMNYPKAMEKSHPKTDETINNEMFTIPNYTIKHRSNVDMGNFTNDPMGKLSVTVPNELVITIDLPLLKCSSDASIDVNEKSLNLISENPAKYKLNLVLPYSVDTSKGSAKFDVSKKMLIVTLPVKKDNNIQQNNNDISRYDSGVESDNGCGRNNNISSNEEEDTEEGSPKICTKILSYGRESLSANNNKYVADNFLKHNLHYVLPKYMLNYFDGLLVLALQVQNVIPESVKYCILNDSTGFHLVFSSIGAGFFPVHYALCFILTQTDQIKKDTFKTEVSENNVVAQVYVSISGVKLTEYFIGTNQNNAKKFSFPLTLEDAADKIQENKLSKECGTHEELLKEDLYISESASSIDEGPFSPQHQQTKPRTVSECQQESKRSKTRGILKIGRSLSESSLKDYESWSSDNNEKPKKTVRFSDVISKQVFRMNSSILGQRKKNQRKTRNKKRAQGRRLSESGNESEGDSDFPNIKGNEDKNWFAEPESSSCDVSEVSDVSDVSESDDGQKENGPPSLPNTSRKNHKRRGKKSARKNAATAKFNYMNY